MLIEEVWLKHNIELKAFVLSIIKNNDTADDVIQETFLKANSKFNQLKDYSKSKSWLFSIAKNTAIDLLRKKTIESDLGNIVFQIEDFETDKHTAKDCLKGLIEKLPEKYKVPILMSDIQGLKQAEVAEKLNLPLATVKSQIQRARKMIAKGYVDCCDFKINNKGYLVGEVKPKDECKVCKN